MLFPATVPIANAAPGGDRTLYLHHTHTGQTGKFTFKRNGKYDQGALRDLNTFLADWRTKDQTKMDPALFDLLWVVYQDVGARNPISIVSSYRAPKTNAMLRAKSSGVAENSQHTRGKAIDFFIPGVKLATLREAVMRHQVGGIGYNMAQPAPLYLSNLLMGTHVIEATRHAETVEATVLVGTVCSYPKYTPVPFAESDFWNGYPEETNAPYGIAKKAHLVHAQVNAAQYGQRLAYLIPTNLYGP
ncbi:DUF882 domain-containing protein, partial [Limnoraphis robusta CCNP1324]|nr:DUF882 domain-containing protein [Limnoraphis robusta CCNP1324]